MGASSSKEPPSTSQYVFTSESPVRFSQELVESLQGSSETDSTREQTHELHIQVRVAEELQRLQAHEAQVLKELEDRISAEMTSTDDGVGGQADAAKVAGDRFRDLGRESIQREISDLRQKLQSRKKLEDLDEGVDRAKSEVVQCLRKNNTRPLDCWKEVETFRREVGRLEKAFLDKTLT